jgi:hypothetical protein
LWWDENRAVRVGRVAPGGTLMVSNATDGPLTLTFFRGASARAHGVRRSTR